MNENIILEKSKAFAFRIIKLYKHLTENSKEFILSKQILRSGTSIGANITESQYGQSDADFYSKLGISLKEAAETKYWLDLLYEGGYIDDKLYASFKSDCEEIIRLLTAIVKHKNDL